MERKISKIPMKIRAFKATSKKRIFAYANMKNIKTKRNEKKNVYNNYRFYGFGS